jgi:dienelactone hydrolase
MIQPYTKTLMAALAVTAASFAASGQSRYVDEVFTDAQLTVVPNVAYGYNFSQYVPATMGGPMVIPMYSDVYMPDTAIDSETARPVVIIFHTGSFLPKGLASPMGDRKDSAVVEIAKRFARRGFVAVSASYRLGWLANSTNLDLRRGTNLMAVYNAVQDAKVCVRAVRASKLALGDPYRIDPSAISLMGAGSGGYITLAYAAINNLAEIASPAKFQYTAAGTGMFGGTVNAGDPYIDTAVVGDWNGYGGKATIIGAHPVTGLPLVDQTQPGRNIELYKGVPHAVNMVVNLGGALGDSAWLAQGDAPIVSFHSRYDFFAPYYRGMVNVPIAGAFFPVVEVAGSHTAVKMSNTFGNNTVLAASSMNDAYSVKARTNPHNVGNQDNIYTFNMLPPNMAMPFRVNANPWDWWDANDPLSANETNPNIKSASMLYIDTVMAYTLPRMAKALNAVGYTISVPEVESVKLQLVPNPTTSNAVVRTYGANATSVEVYDILGRPVFASTVNASEVELPSAAWAPGAYFVRLHTERGVHTAKLIRH